MGGEPVRLGIGIVDSLLPRGVLPGTLITMMGPPGIGKSYFTMMVVRHALGRGRPAFFVSLDDVVQSEPEKGFYAIAGFKTPIPMLEGRFSANVNPENPRQAIETITLLVKRIAEERNVDGGVLVIDSINTILIAAETFVAFDFIRGVKALCRNYGLLGIIDMHTGIPGFEQLEAIVSYMVDGVVEMGFDPQLEELGFPLRRLRVRRMRGVPHRLQWVPFTISDEGPVAIDINLLMEQLKRLTEARRSGGQ